jgi:hypothetical protein
MHKQSLQGVNVKPTRLGLQEYDSDEELFDQANMNTKTLEGMVEYLQTTLNSKNKKRTMLPAIVSPKKINRKAPQDKSNNIYFKG